MDEEINLVPYLIALLILLFSSVFALLVYSGLFTKIVVGAGPPPLGDVRILYKFARGPYKEAGRLFTETHCLAPDLQKIGIYYDDPQQVNPADLRYCVGVLLDRPHSEDQRKNLTDNGFQEMKLPAIENAVISKFPFNNTASIIIGVARVYPKLAEYIQEKKLCAHPMIEIYTDKEIVFMSPLSRQDEFYVKEMAEQEYGSQPEDSDIQAEGEELTSEGEENGEMQDNNEEAALPNGSVEENDDSSGSSFEELQH